MPTLTNTDGDLLSPTIDHYRYDSSSEAQIKDRLGRVPGVDVREEGSGETVFVLLRRQQGMPADWGGTVIGQVWMRDGTLRIDSLSQKRADANRKLVERSLGHLVTWRVREEVNVQSELKHRTTSNVSASPAIKSVAAPFEPPPELRERMRQYRQDMMDSWPEERVPALAMRTPHEAWATRAGRREVELLLREFENNEARMPAEDRIDIGRIRTRLGLGK